MEKELIGRPRYRVRFREEPGARLQSEETLAGKPPRKSTICGFPVLMYTRQADGDMRIISTELVEEVVIEQTDKYGDWHKTGTWTN